MSFLEKNLSREFSRRSETFHAQSQSYLINGVQRTVRIEIDTDLDSIDPENSRLFFDLAFTAPDTNVTVIKDVGSAIIKNLRIKTKNGALIGQEIRNYNAYCRMYNDLVNSSDYDDSFGRAMENRTPFKTYAATAHQPQFSHSFVSGILALKKYYPAHFHRGLIIEFDLPTTVNEIFQYAAENAPTSISIQNVYYKCDLVQLNANIEQQLFDLMVSNALKVDYESVYTFPEAIATSATSHNVDLIGIDGKIKAAYAYFIDEDATDGQAKETADWWGVKRLNALSSYRYRIGSHYINKSDVQVSSTRRAEQIFELSKAIDGHHTEARLNRLGNSNQVASTTLADNELAIFAVKTSKAQKNVEDTISSLLDKERNNLRLELAFSSGISASQSVYVHVLLDQAVVLQKGGSVSTVPV